MNLIQVVNNNKKKCIDRSNVDAATAAKSLQSCPTLCDHGLQPTRLPVPGILQARTLEWVVISFSNA